jgi:hypothetical protein
MFTLFAHQQIGRVGIRADTQTDFQKVETRMEGFANHDFDSEDHDAA